MRSSAGNAGRWALRRRVRLGGYSTRHRTCCPKFSFSQWAPATATGNVAALASSVRGATVGGVAPSLPRRAPARSEAPQGGGRGLPP